MALVAVGAVAMVGIYPPSHPPAFGSALAWAFHHVPGALAFRTTSKAGAIELVGLVLLAGLAADVLVPRLRDSLARGAALVGALALLAVSVAPAVSGGLYPGGLPLPAYWRTAAADLQDRAATGRVWFVPGETNAIYRWGRRSVDDMGPGLLVAADAGADHRAGRTGGGEQRDRGSRLRSAVRHSRARDASPRGPATSPPATF